MLLLWLQEEEEGVQKQKLRPWSLSFFLLLVCACVCWASTQKNIRKRTTHLIVLLLLPSAAWREPYLFDYNMDRQVPVAGTYHSATLFMMCTHTHTTRTISSRRRRKVTRGCLSLSLLKEPFCSCTHTTTTGMRTTMHRRPQTAAIIRRGR